MKSKRIGRREREYLTHREEILAAAKKAFAAKGFFPTTMSDIAKESEFGMGTLYKYFKSKDELFFTLIDNKMEEINRLVKSELSQKTSAVERIRKVLKSLFEFIERNREFFRIYIPEQNPFEWTVKIQDDLGKVIHGKMIAYINILVKFMRQGINSGEFKPLDPRDTAHALLGIVNSLVIEWLISKENYSLISKLETVLEIFLGGVQRMERRRVDR